MFKFMLLSALVWVKELPSTQDELKRGGYPSGTVLVADRQTAGRGRRGRRWLSDEGGLYFSFLLRPELFPELLPLPVVLGLAVCRLLENEGLRPSLKWPNDVYLSGRKLCGILTEVSKSGLVVGVGLNVNQTSFPEGLNATSLKLETGRTLDRKELLLKLLKSFSEELGRFRQEGFKGLRKEAVDRLLWLGEEVKLSDGRTGKLAGLSERGGLLLLTERGLEEVLSGELTLRLNARREDASL
ncbi:MAG: biotin--[acetyl-CoA-carboxylase] ligase [Aquificae bacterium]|nr:biotin--[acetyl-CoA-carboxylase] ligase [Aquificota bacterium]